MKTKAEPHRDARSDLILDQGFMTLLHAVPVPIVLVDVEGRVLSCGPAMESLTGYTQEELAGSLVRDWMAVDTDDARRVMRCLENPGRGQEQEWHELVIKHRDGTRTRSVFKRRVLRLPAGKPVTLLIAGDVTEREGTEKGLHTISEAASRFLESGSEEDIFDFIGRTLKDLVGRAAVSINSFDPDRNLLVNRGILGVGPEDLAWIAEQVGEKVLGISFNDVDQEIQDRLLSGRLQEVEEGLFGNLFRRVPRSTCLEIERRIGIRDVWAIGFRRGRRLYGNASIFMLEDTKINKAVVEAFINLASIALERREAEDALKVSEAFLNRITEFSPFAMWTADEKGNVVRTNRALRETLNLTDERIIGKYNIFLDENLEEAGVMPMVRAVFEKHRPARFSIPWSGPGTGSPGFSEGRDLVIDVSMFPILDQEGTLANVVCQWVDITRQTRVEERLRASEEQYRELVENINDVVYSVEGDGAIRYVSAAVESVLGYAPAEVIGRSFADFVHPEDRKVVDRAFEDVLHGRLYPSEYRMISKSGSYRWVRTSSRPVRAEGGTGRLQGILSDITEYKRAEHALRESEERYRSLFNDALDMIQVLDPEGRIIDANPVQLETLGYAREEFIGKHLSAVLHPGFREETARVLNEVLGGREVNGYETALMTKAGGIVHVEVNAVPRIEDGKVIAARAILRDITERKEAEAARTKLEQEFHHAQRLESVGRLAGGVAHDLNNMLTPIIGYAEIALEGTSEEDLRREPLKEIVDAAWRARDLVGRLLAFSRRQALEFKPVDVNALVRGFEKLLRRTLREDIAIRLGLADSLPSVVGDPGQLEQVVMNLAVNAQDAMPEGGFLTIETARVELDEAYAVERQGVKPGSYVMLAVSDTGLGLDAETREHLFEPFFTTKGREKGTGLGLATVYGIVKQHGGNVWAYGEPGLGATFKVYLPAAEECPASKKADSGREKDVGGSETVLLVEDNGAVRKLGVALLKEKGYQVLAAASGEEALALLDAHDGPVHLLLVDVIMPDMNGKELSDRVSALHPDTKILYMSGYTDDVIVHHGVSDEGVHFLQKPFSGKSLNAKVREVLDE